MGASCVSNHQKDEDEYDKIDMDEKIELLPTSPITILFEVMSEEIGYEAAALQSHCDKLQSLWIYRVIDVLNIDDLTWNELSIPSVLEHVIKDYLNELKETMEFKNYSRLSHTDIYVTFINKDIRTLFKHLLESVNNLECAQKDILYLESIFDERYLFHTDKIKKYMTKKEWMELNVPTNLKNIIFRKINLKFNGEEHIANNADDISNDDNDDNDDEKLHENDDEGEEALLIDDDDDDDDDDDINNKNDKISLMLTPKDEIRGLHNMSSKLSSKLQAVPSNDDISDDDDQKKNLFFDETINKHINVRFNMMKIAEYFSKNLLVHDIERIYNHLKYFVEYGYNTIYHLSFISDTLFYKLLQITKTPKVFQCELYELIVSVRNKYGDSMNNILHILPFESLENKSQNVYWEKQTFSAFKILENDINLKLDKECNILMNNFYSNIWDWQFIGDDIFSQLNGYNKYEIVRIRMQHIIKLCQYRYGIQNIPLLPPIWNSQYNTNLLIHKILEINKNKNKNNNVKNNDIRISDIGHFHFDGLDWNETTKYKIEILLQFLDRNFVRKLQFLPIQHQKNDKLWSQLIFDNNISSHLRFKINFYAIQGLPKSDDNWINNYIQKNYKKILPQFKQSMDCDIITGKEKMIYNDIENKVICIENLLHSINLYKNMDIDIIDIEYKDNNNKPSIFEINQSIKTSIKEINEMGLNEQLYDIIQFCGTKQLNQLKMNKFSLLIDENNFVDLTKFDQTKISQLKEINNILFEMKKKIYSLPIDGILILSKNICTLVQKLSDELKKYDTKF